MLKKLIEDKYLFLVFMLFILLRIWRGGYAWFFEWDEYYTFHMARFSLADVWQILSYQDTWPPLGVFVYKAIIAGADYSVLLCRLASVLISLAGTTPDECADIAAGEG